MKLLYTHENPLIVGNVRNIIDAAGIDTLYKNEFVAGGMGEVPVFDVWLELWVSDDEDYERGTRLIAEALDTQQEAAWTCNRCGERNGPAFELCWNCQADRARS